MRMGIIILLAFGFSLEGRAAVEFKSNLLPSFAAIGRSDLVLSTHNTLLFGGDAFRAGLYAAYETISVNTTDTSVGAALRFGKDSYFEMQGGSFRRGFSQSGTSLSGTGFSANLIYGFHLTPHWGLALFLSGKRISGGDLDKRWIVDLLPFLSLRVEF